MKKSKAPHLVYSIVVECRTTGTIQVYFIEGKFGKSSQNKAINMAIADGMENPKITSVMIEHPVT